AVDHLLQPADPDLLGVDVPLVLVDDELSTGRTALNLIRQLQPRCPSRSRYLIAALVDLRTAADRDRMAELATELGVRIEVVALATAELRLAPDVLARRAVLAAECDQSDPERPDLISTISTLHWPAGVIAGGRHGFDPAHRVPLERAACRLAEQLTGQLGDRVLVLGCEELMYAPLRIATALAGLGGPGWVRFSATTRSPVLTVDQPGYPIRTRLRFPVHDEPADGPGPRFAYNVHPGADPRRRFTDIVLVIDGEADTAALRQPGGLLAQLTRATDRVWLVRIPDTSAELPSPLHGPAFGSYRVDEVSWLLTDLSGIELEAPAEEREEAIQAGTAHYAESLPIEYQPGEEYLALYRQALAQSADRLAYAVGVVAELLLAEHGPDLVLASLARAGTPIGVLIRRWAQLMHGLELPHHAISIVRGQGIDELALRYLASRYATERVAFVDGWTGKGAIAKELTAAVQAANDRLGSRFSAELAVLADPGQCARIYGTRQDYLIPSACLNSTVSGLISRTVLNRRLLTEQQFHGAKFYSELAAADVSRDFLDAVSSRFAEVADQVSGAVRERKAVEPSWLGWRTVEQLARRYGIDDLNLIKPGVGEATRVLLRRVPWKVLVRPDALAELDHLLLLAEQRGVPVEPVEDLCFSCVGLILGRS
ncbi:MAG TPA: phosphoribosyltransferase domain-containing protein, partial [Jatrophihabitans sp.]|nr:phosphoribosyltransferase domain-containing protein [Jatrophihabitans sp.]